ncbi:hypothetical protein B296_00010113 [Ensete ventricosum]|uniref:Uncharacterized protein n=1 Tax=Ensete ventricosum TaxID=4639 RepID=A0A427B7G7_ENSVE|nr:hypothetical protein B296_00010113 [Ensete ventricosum]
MLGVRWEFAEENRLLTEGSLKGCREFTRSSSKDQLIWELAKSLLEAEQDSDDVVGSTPRAHQRFTRKFLGSSLIGCPELAGRMFGVRREFTEGNRELIGGSLEGNREFAERSIDSQTTKIMC